MTNKELDLDHDSMVMGKEAECMSLAAGEGVAVVRGGPGSYSRVSVL